MQRRHIQCTHAHDRTMWHERSWTRTHPFHAMCHCRDVKGREATEMYTRIGCSHQAGKCRAQHIATPSAIHMMMPKAGKNRMTFILIDTPTLLGRTQRQRQRQRSSKASGFTYRHTVRCGAVMYTHTTDRRRQKESQLDALHSTTYPTAWQCVHD